MAGNVAGNSVAYSYPDLLNLILCLQWVPSQRLLFAKLALKLKMATTLDEMAALFATKTSNLKRSMELRSAGKPVNSNFKLYVVIMCSPVFIYCRSTQLM